MSGKRGASSDLNHDNWDQSDEPEEAGRFSIAPKEELQKRVIRTAKRKLPSNNEVGTKNAFSGFTGFKTTPPVSSSNASPFSFLQKSTTTTPITTDAKSSIPTLGSNGSSQVLPKNGMSPFGKTEIKPSFLPEIVKKIKTDDENGVKKSENFYAKIKGLNNAVSKWIQKHVNEDPCCILTPIFQDYNKFLSEIESEEEKKTKEKSEENKSSEIPSTTESSAKFLNNITSSSTSTSTSKPIFSFSSNSLSTKSIFDGKKDVGSDNPFLQKKIEPEKTKEIEKEKEKTAVTSNKTESDSKPLTFPPTSLFSFGQTSSATSPPSAGFSFGGGKPFTFGNSAAAPKDGEQKAGNDGDDDEYEPPKVEVKSVSEEGAIYEQRCKVFVKKDGNFTDRGVGTLFLKPTPSGKTQLIVRAETSIGNLLLNTLLTESIPTKRMNKNNVMLVCLPLPDSAPPPTPVLLRVKTSEDADKLLEALDNNKK